MTKARVYISDYFDPYYNLAIENGLLERFDGSEEWLFLWRNDPCVVMGRFQNPWVECNTKKMKRDQLPLVRRQSGGGTVYHDHGNLCFTFFHTRENFDRKKNLEFISNAFKKLDVDLQINERHDLVMQTERGLCKVSGSAFKQKKDRAFHHGTLLIDSDLTRLADYLNPDKREVEARGITSVRSNVANIKEVNAELNVERVVDCLAEEFFTLHQTSGTINFLGRKFLQTFDTLESEYQKLKDWNWCYGETPRFNHRMENRFEWGAVDVHLDSHRGKITDTVIYSDAFHPEMIEILAKGLVGREYTPSGVADAISEVRDELPMIGEQIEEFGDWLASSIH